MPAVIAALGMLALLAGPVYAERSETGGLIVFIKGGISPRKLPRSFSAPVAVRLQAGIRTAESIPLPRVKSIKLELAWRGALDVTGLPICPQSRLRFIDSRQATSVCGSALVGSGSLYDRVFIPDQAPFGLHARLLVFNGKTKRGHTAVYVLAYTSDPPVSFVLPFHVRRQSGPFPTVLVTRVPRSIGPWPHFAHFSIVVSRHFSYRGRTHSYLSASCPLPPRFTSGPLSLARATFELAEGPDLKQETVRTCRAR